jgi:hypothetical protein
MPKNKAAEIEEEVIDDGEEQELGETEEVTGEEAADEVSDPENPDGEEAEGDDEAGLLEGEQPARPSRREATVLRAKEQARTEREAREKSDREVAELKVRLEQLQRSQQGKEDPEEEERKMALMTPRELVDYKLNKALGGFTQQMAMSQFQTADVADKTAFQTLCASDPRARRFAGKVEQILAEHRQRGQNVKREDLLKYVVGEEVFKKPAKTPDKQRQDGQRNIQRHTTKPVNARGDVATNRGKTGKTAADRLANVRI